MLIDKPPWARACLHVPLQVLTVRLQVQHDKKRAPLYALDLSSDAARFATSGLDHLVKIWALAPVLSAEAEADAAQPKLLATLAEHFGPVNALRFSASGRRLASGSDDKSVFLHELRGGAPRATFGSSEPPAVENWQASARRRPSESAAHRRCLRSCCATCRATRAA